MVLKRSYVAVLLLGVPLLVVLILKNGTAYGPLLATPAARQKGAPNAKVTIVEYSDFQCPSCANIQPYLQNIMDTYKGNVRLYFKYFPLSMIHKNALAAAHAAECAARQDKFWPYGDLLFQRQAQWAPLADGTTHYMAIAEETHLDMTRFQACMADPSADVTVQQDVKEGQNREISATPTFFVDDERLVGGTFAEGGARAVERELRR